MLPKRCQAPTSMPSMKHTRSTCSSTSYTTSAQDIRDSSNIHELSSPDLALLPAKIAIYKLSPIRNKMTMSIAFINFCIQYCQSYRNGVFTLLNYQCTSAGNGTVVFIFQQLNSATPNAVVDTSSNNSPSTESVTPDGDETLSAASKHVTYIAQQPPTATYYSKVPCAITLPTPSCNYCAITLPLYSYPSHSHLFMPMPVNLHSCCDTCMTYYQPTIVASTTPTYQRSYHS